MEPLTDDVTVTEILEASPEPESLNKNCNATKLSCSEESTISSVTSQSGHSQINLEYSIGIYFTC